jgi:hypothetical protein
MIRTIFIAAALAVTLPTAPAQAAGVPRTFLSAAGSDSNNCANVATPCRHMAAAFAATAPDGEIYVLDPANYGSLTITGPVSIEGHGWASIAPVSGSAAITITANPGDKINIIGVVLDGTAIANTNGIKFNSGGSLTVRDSVIRNFTLNGIVFAPSASSQLLVSNTLVSDQDNGIFVDLNGGTTVGVLDHVVTENNSGGGIIVSTFASGAIANVIVSDCVSANNNRGIKSETLGNGGQANVMVRNSTIANNSIDGLSADNSGAVIRVTRSTITGNNTGWAAVSTGVVLSYADNNIDGNGTANTEPPSPLSYK